MSKVYVVQSHRWGSLENHGYLVGVFDNMKEALEQASLEEMFRGGKYGCTIEKVEIGLNDLNQNSEIHKTNLFVDLSARTTKNFMESYLDRQYFAPLAAVRDNTDRRDEESIIQAMNIPFSVNLNNYDMDSVVEVIDLLDDIKDTIEEDKRMELNEERK